MSALLHNIAWVAGLFEGEGSIVIRDRYEPGHGNSRSVALSIASTDYDTIERAFKVMNVGSTNGLYLSRRPNCKPAWYWRVNHAVQVCEVLNKLLPYLGQRRTAKAVEAIDFLKKNRLIMDPPKQCKNGHPLNDQNVYYAPGKKYRYCRPCRRKNVTNYRARLLA